VGHLETFNTLLRDPECYNQDTGVEAPAVLWTLLWFAAYEGNAAPDVSWPCEAEYRYVLAHLEELGLIGLEEDGLIFVRYSGSCGVAASGDVAVYRESVLPALQEQFDLATPLQGVHFFADSMDHAIEMMVELAPYLSPTEQPQGDMFPSTVEAPKLRKTRGTGARTTAERLVVTEVFEDWQRCMGYQKLKLTDTREDAIINRWRAGYSILQMQNVTKWVSNDDWMRGRAQGSTRKFDDLVFYMESNTKFERYLHQAVTGGITTRDSSLQASDAPVRAERMT